LWVFGLRRRDKEQAGPFGAGSFALSDARLSVDDVKRHLDVAWATDGIGILTETLIVALGKRLVLIGEIGRVGLG
jgi:hypothetical protein